ncbi:tubulin polyglutamylase TTLL5-like isoform X1 [Mytilus californianus]|uniref:tubulin polyglutamylase TTLL5-like isoform X1 n=1 Tax=Mytilus californianus TaxID=6549 RepID=UPI0022483AC0|nr:tubulin polyglutamylase TTLL5-like isoform X1 [Mytilus californianus]
MSDNGSGGTPSEHSEGSDNTERDSDYESEEEENKEQLNIQWTGYGKKTPVITFNADVVLNKKTNQRTVGERYHLAYKFGGSETKVIRNILNFHGFHEVHPNSSDFNVMWTGSHLKPFTLRGLTEFQKINHFPRSYEITRKDRLFKNVQRMQQIKGVKHFDFIPPSFILPSEYQDFCACFLREKGTWIVKPVASSRGRGVFLVNHPDQVPLDENLIVCKYLANPLLIDGFKFDVRLYVCVTSYDPLTIYLFEEGLTRFATVKYEKSNRHIRNQCMHLTNYSVNKKSDDYVKNDDPEVEDYGNKWSLGALLRYLRSHGKDTAALMMKIEDVIIKTIISVELPIATACKMFMPHKGNCFELYGFDVLVDDNMKPWVLEVNLSPSLACDSPLDSKIKTNMISDLLSMSGIVCHDPMMRTLQQSRRNQDVSSKMGARAKLFEALRKERITGKITSARYRPSSATNADSWYQLLRQRQRPQSASSTGGGRNNGDKNQNSTANKGMAGLNSDEIKILRRIKEEDQRKGGYVRIFPTADSWDIYMNFLQFNTTNNLMVHQRLYPERHKTSGVSSSGRSGTTSVGARAKISSIFRSKSAYSSLSGTSIKSDSEYAECYAQAILRTRQYERKLGSGRRGRRRRRRVRRRPKLAQGVAEEDGEEEGEDEKDDKKSDEENDVIDDEVKESESKDETKKENVVEVQVEKSVPKSDQGDVGKPPKPPTTKMAVHKEVPIEIPVEEERPPTPPREPRYNVVELLQKGCTLRCSTVSKVQARSAFAMYLVRVQQRLVTEGSPSSQDDSDALNEQMDLVLRFLKRAAVNLQQPFKVVVPSRKLPLNDRRRILAKQLGDFVYIYNKLVRQAHQETEQLKVKRLQDKKAGKIAEAFPNQKEVLCEKKFEEFVNTASESELEDVLTTYTKINKSASIFLGGNPKHSSSDTSNHSKGTSGSSTTVAARNPQNEGSRQVLSGWDDIPKVSGTVASTSTSGTAPTTSESKYGSSSSLASEPLRYQTPSQSSFANAVHCYTQKLTTNRPRSASTSSQRPGSGVTTRPHMRPMSAAHARPVSAYATTDPTVDSYNDEAIQNALQRLAIRQQARQYSPYNSTTIIPQDVEAKSRIGTAKGQRPSDMLQYRSNSVEDNSYVQTNVNTYMPAGRTVDSAQRAFVSAEEMGIKSRPSSASYHRQTGDHAGNSQTVQSNVNLQSANATFNNFIDTNSGHNLHSDLAMAYSQVTGVAPQNYHTASQTSKQFQLLQQQQALKQQSRVLLEQSKAKHQAMIAQAVQKTNPPRPTMRNINGEIHIESAIQKYAPKPPIQPSHHRKPTGQHRAQRQPLTEESLTFNFYNSLKHNPNVGSSRPSSASGW